MTAPTLGTYLHRQRGLLWLACLLPAVLMGGVVFFAAEVPPWMRAMFAVMAGLLLVLSSCFVWLETRDDGDALAVRFGPMRSFSLTVPYADIESVAATRSALIDGWGIHYIPGRGWTWNLQGRDCVELRLRSGKQLRIGTDDPDGLIALLRSRISTRE